MPATARPRRSRLGVTLVVFGYVVPLLVAAALLFVLGDVVIGVALLTIEAFTVTSIHVALNRPSPHDRPHRLPGEPVLGLPGDLPPGSTNRSLAIIGAAMAGVVLLLAALAVVAAHMG